MTFQIFTTLVWVLSLLIFSGQSFGLKNWPEISSNLDVAIRTQRDVSNNVPPGQINGFGISLNRMLFDKMGYSPAALDDLSTLLDLKPSSLMIDLYWDDHLLQWQLCPTPNSSVLAPYTRTKSSNSSNVYDWCKTNISTSMVINHLKSYFDSSDRDTEVDFIQLLFNLRSKGNIAKMSRMQQRSARLSDVLSLTSMLSPLGLYLLTPADLQNYKNIGMNKFLSFYNQSKQFFPLQHTALFEFNKRSMAIVLSTDSSNSNVTYKVTERDENMIFFPGKNITVEVTTSSNGTALLLCQALLNSDTPIPKETLDFMSLDSGFRFAIDHPTRPFSKDTYKDLVSCGYTPVLNAGTYKLNDNKASNSLSHIANYFVLYSFWSWTYQSLRHGDSFLRPSGNESDLEDDPQVAYNCVLMDDGWKVGNCYDRYSFACQSDENPNVWYIDQNVTREYFSASEESVCRDGFRLGFPSLSIENLALSNYIKSRNISKPVWIDVNDITVSGCFVTGGPYNDCPYQRTVTKEKLIELIAPGFVVSIAVLVLIFLERIFRVNPIQSNRKRYWKKVITKYNKTHEYEGVPS